ncbi:hypothetical protein CRV08_00480 [Halarcobacter ebronensis]|uniref:Lipoprotein n=1 Tax=Halarcobacter ebronensis TaxID=1462615 RepID=A0A4Q0YIC3_9BACT|nr:hypothetical protein [Halarcobacter ebronensis]RXJ70073.1 hypothetical protein CRV08_00480 [Halarcobacter ebronensis]
MKQYLLLILTFLFIGCSNKYVSIKSLQPSEISGTNISNVFLEQFTNDDINQTNYLETQLVNAKVDNKKIFTIKPTHEGVDAIISGEVLESSFDFRIYYDESLSSRCVRYEYVNGARTGNCIEYRRLLIPCERRDYRVKTQVKVLNMKHEVIFSKIYSKSDYKNECYRYNEPYFGFMLYNNLNYEKEKKRVNTQLAKRIADEIIEDLSPHYVYQKATLIEELAESFGEKNQKEFEQIVELLNKQQISLAQDKLQELNKKLDSKSYETLYNLALTYEAQHNNFMARTYLLKAQKICKESDDLKLIENALIRIKSNEQQERKAKSQLSDI